VYRGKELVRGSKKSRKLRESFRLDGLRACGVYWRSVLYENECLNEWLPYVVPLRDPALASWDGYSEKPVLGAGSKSTSTVCCMTNP